MPKDIINTIPNTNRARRNNDRIPEYEDDYVLEGCGLSIDANNELTITSGELITLHGDQVYHVAVAARTGADTITVPDNSSLGVYYDIQPNDIVLQASAPASPSLQIGTVDSSAGDTTELNREPVRRSRSVETGDVSGDQYVTRKSGSTLAERVMSALDDLPGGSGKIIAPPKPDGTAWDAGDLSVDPTQYNGFEIVVSGRALVDYGGEDWGWTFDSGGDVDSQINGSTVAVRGGHWTASGDPTGLFRLKDMYNAEINVTAADITNSDGDASILNVENHDAFSEAGEYGVVGENVDRGIYFTNLSETGGTGTNSYQGTNITNLAVTYNDIGLRTAGGFSDCYVENAELLANADGATGLKIWNASKGTLFVSPKFDNPGTENANVTPIETASTYKTEEPPMFIQPRFLVNDESDIVRGDPADPLPALAVGESGNNIGGIQAKDLGNGLINDIPKQTGNSADAWYQNGSAYSKEINAHAQASGDGSIARIKLHINDEETDNVVDQSSVTAASSDLVDASVQGEVPPGAYYKVQIDDGSLWRIYDTNVGL